MIQYFFFLTVNAETVNAHTYDRSQPYDNEPKSIKKDQERIKIKKILSFIQKILCEVRIMV